MIIETRDYIAELKRIENPTIVHLALLTAVREWTTDMHPWFGARRCDWYDICQLTIVQYDRAAKALQNADLITRRRASEKRTGMPLILHAINVPWLAEPRQAQNVVVYRNYEW